jgi:hypothetical protein
VNRDGPWQKLRSNIPFALSVVAAAGLVLLSILPRESGAGAWVLRAIAAIVLATFGPIATQVEKRRADEAKRLDVSLAIREEQVTTFPGENQLVEQWLTDEQEACLLSVNQFVRRHAASSRPMNFDVRPTSGGPTIGEVLDLEKRDAQGEQLTPGERHTLSEARKSFGEVYSKISLFSRPENRTAEQYRDEVAAYLDRARVAALLRLTQELVAAGLGQIQIELNNATDRPFQNVIVELRLPAGVEVFTEALPKRERASIPPRPREFGPRAATDFGYVPRAPDLSWLSLRPHLPRPPEPRIRIESNDFVKVTFPGVGLRPTGAVRLPVLFVVVRQDLGSTLKIGWEATADNANGRAEGTIALYVRPSPSVDDLIGRVLRDRRLDVDR